MGRRILIVCVALMLVAGAAVGFSRLSEPVPSTTIVRDSSDTVLVIEREYDSVEAMQLAAATDGVTEGHYVLINTGNVEDPDHARVYIKGADGYELVADLSGATGKQGLQGEKGADGAHGITPLLMINAEGYWTVSYDLGMSWESLGVKAQGPKGDTGATGAQGIQGPKGDTGATGAQGIQGPKGDTGATGAQGPAYVLTDADKQAIIEAVLEQVGGKTVYYVWNRSADSYLPISSPDKIMPYMHICSCGVILFDDCDGYTYSTCPGCHSENTFSHLSNSFYVEGGGGGETGYYRYDMDQGWISCEKTYNLDPNMWVSDCGATFYHMYGDECPIDVCPHCGSEHYVYGWESNPYY